MWHALVFSAFPNGQFAKFSFIYVFIRFLLSQIVSFFRKVFFSWSFLFMLFFFSMIFSFLWSFFFTFFSIFFLHFFSWSFFSWSFFSWSFFVHGQCSMVLFFLDLLYFGVMLVKHILRAKNARTLIEQFEGEKNKKKKTNGMCDLSLLNAQPIIYISIERFYGFRNRMATVIWIIMKQKCVHAIQTKQTIYFIIFFFLNVH